MFNCTNRWVKVDSKAFSDPDIVENEDISSLMYFMCFDKNLVFLQEVRFYITSDLTIYFRFLKFSALCFFELTFFLLTAIE